MLTGMREAFQNGDVRVVATPTASLHAMGYVLEPLLDTYFQMGWTFWRPLPSRSSQVIVRSIAIMCRCARTFHMKGYWISSFKCAFRSPARRCSFFAMIADALK